MSHDPYAALRLPNYRRFAGGWVFASCGLQMMSMAISWEVWHRTQSYMALGFIGVARVTPVLLMALPAGHAADIFDRKKILLFTQIAFVMAACAIAAVSYYQLPIWTLYAMLVLMGCARSFNGPSRSSLLPLIVPEGTFQNAVSWNSFVFQFSAVGGPLLAGWMIHQTGKPYLDGWFHGKEAAWPVYLATAAGCAIFAATVSGVRPKAIERRARGVFTLTSMFAGMSHVYKEKTILAALSLDLCAVILGGATALLPAYAGEILHVGPLGLGALNAGQYIGALAMSFVLAHRPPFKKAGPALLWCVAGYGAGTIAFGFSTNFILSMAMLFVLGALDTVSVVVRHVLVQTRTPDSLRGRVSAVNSVFIESSNELGKLESGAVASLAGTLGATIAGAAVISVVSGGIGTILVVGAVLAWPQIRRLGKLDPEKGEATDSPPA